MTLEMDFDDPTVDHEHEHGEALSGMFIWYYTGGCILKKDNIDMARRIHDLNERVQDIRREQSAQRVSICNADMGSLKMILNWMAVLQEREAEYRDHSELINSRVVWWTLLQLIVLGGICAWQLNHYKQFFVAKKLV